MSESCAVPLYVAQLLRSPLALQPGVDADYPAFLNWMHHADATLTFPMAIVMRYSVFEPGRADGAAEDYARWFHARLKLLNQALDDGRSFLCGNRFSVADVCVASALFMASEHGFIGGGLKAAGKQPLGAGYKLQTQAYLERMMERPGWQAAMTQQDNGAPSI